MQTTTNFGFNIVEGADIVNPMTDFNPNFNIMETKLTAANNMLVSPCTHSKSGNIHQVSRTRLASSLSPSPIMRFVATANWNEGDILRVDSTSYLTVTTPDGEPLKDNAFVTGCGVVVIVGIGNSVTVLTSNKYIPTASEVTTTGGDSVQDYIDNTKFKNLETWTPNIGENWETFLARIRDNSTKTIPANFIRCTVDGVSGLIFRQSRRTSATSWQYETDYFTGNSLIKYVMSVGSDSAVLRKYDILNGTVQNLSSADAQIINIYGLDV